MYNSNNYSLTKKNVIAKHSFELEEPKFSFNDPNVKNFMAKVVTETKSF